MRIVPIDFATAKAHVAAWHRHHRPPVGHKFSIGAMEEGEIVGVLVAGRPVARHYDDGFTIEVTRSATNGHPNANSMLYGAAARAAFALGYDRIITYTQAGESGASLRAAGYRVLARRSPRKGWDAPSRPRINRNDEIERTLWGSSVAAKEDNK